MPPTDELAGLLARCARRDADALERLYRLASPQLFAVALRILRVSHRAEEALQDGFIRIWQHAGEYRPERGAPLTWMASIVRYRALDLRRRDMAARVTYPGELDHFADAKPGPLLAAQSAAEARALERCLEHLEGKQRHCIMLAFYEGMSHAELSAHLHEKLGTVKSWIRRGLERLRTCLQP